MNGIIRENTSHPRKQTAHSRRSHLKTMFGASFSSVFMGCAGGFLSMNRGIVAYDVNRKIHWARREQWNGPEAVYGVAIIGDRYLLVKHSDEWGWGFPGGRINPKIHGSKQKTNDDLLAAVTNYVHSQALIPLTVEETRLKAYGYAIDMLHNENILVHWFAMAIPASMPPSPHANLDTTLQARWIGIDDPTLGKCLQQKIEEFVNAQEGNTLIIQPCKA